MVAISNRNKRNFEVFKKARKLKRKQRIKKKEKTYLRHVKTAISQVRKEWNLNNFSILSINKKFSINNLNSRVEKSSERQKRMFVSTSH